MLARCISARSQQRLLGKDSLNLQKQFDDMQIALQEAADTAVDQCVDLLKQAIVDQLEQMRVELKADMATLMGLD